MIDLKNTETKLITLNSEAFDVDQFYQNINQPEVCIGFINFDQAMLDNLFINAGFTKMEKAADCHYFKIDSGIIFVIYIELRVSNFVIREKYWLIHSEATLDSVKSFTQKSFCYGTFTDFESDSEIFDYKLYPETMDRPFYVSYCVRSAYAQPKLLRVDIALKYGNDKFVIYSIFDQADKHIQISYDTYTKDCNYVYASFLEFINEKLVKLEICTPTNKSNTSIVSHMDDINIDTITLHNYHLFWETLSPEQVTLIEMLIV